MASLFPGSPQLEVDRPARHAGPAGLEPFVERVTFTLPTIQAAKRIVFLVTGAGKAEAVARAFGGEISRACRPASPGSRRFRSRSSSTRLRRPKWRGDEHARAERHAQEVLELDGPEQLKALGHPLRLKVLQALGDADEPMTNRELAARLSVDPGHLHFHVRMLHRAGLIELAASSGREKPYRPVAKHCESARRSARPGSRASSRRRSFATCSAASSSRRDGRVPHAQVHARLDAETIRRLVDELIQQLTELEDETKPIQTITIAFHPRSSRAKRTDRAGRSGDAGSGSASRGAARGRARAPCRPRQPPRGSPRASRTT